VLLWKKKASSYVSLQIQVFFSMENTSFSQQKHKQNHIGCLWFNTGSNFDDNAIMHLFVFLAELSPLLVLVKFRECISYYNKVLWSMIRC
jgi:hypothetical protein